MRFLRSLLVGGLLLLSLISLAAAGFTLTWMKREKETLPQLSHLIEYKPPSVTRVLASDGRELATLAQEYRVPVRLDEVPLAVQDAFLAAEDERFWQHFGVDPVAILRAAVSNVARTMSGRRAHGASTISQQVAKLLVIGDERSLSRKAREAMLAIHMEREIGKERIFEIYLNQIYLGAGAYGVKAAAEVYFGKPLEELTPAEAAFLAGLPKAPSAYDPIRHPEAARARRAYVLGRMLALGKIHQVAHDLALASPLPQPVRRSDGVNNHAIEQVRREMLELVGFDSLYRDGHTVHTSIDIDLQRLAEDSLRRGIIGYDRRMGWRGALGSLPVEIIGDHKAVEKALSAFRKSNYVPAFWTLAVVTASAETGLAVLDERGSERMLQPAAFAWAVRNRKAALPVRPGDLVLVDDTDIEAPILAQIPEAEGALVAVDVGTGDLLAMAGGFDFADSSFNRANQARRQPGSAFKPFVYLAALENGYEPDSIVLDTPIALDTGAGQDRWRPENYSGGGGGPMTLSKALEQSRNLATIRIVHDLGLDAVLDTAARFGFMPEQAIFSMALGAAETTVQDMAVAYAPFANGGYKVMPHLLKRVTAADGTDLQIPLGGKTEEMLGTPENIARLDNMLHRVTTHGTAASTLGKLPYRIAGKTGTTNESHDVWFVGYAGRVAVAVWVGFDQPTGMGSKETGGRISAPVFGDFIQKAMQTHPDLFPADLARVRYAEPKKTPEQILEMAD